MKNIYLKKPYQVLSFAQVNRKQKDSPIRLYRAEHNLRVATNFRDEKMN